MTTATIKIGNGKPTSYDVKDGQDFDVTVTIGDRTIDGSFTLAPSQYDGRLVPYGNSLDMWTSGLLCQWLESLTPGQRREACKALEDRFDGAEIEIEIESAE